MFPRIIYSLLTVFGSLTVGYLARKGSHVNEERSSLIIKLGTIFISPWIFCFNFWALEKSNISIITLPLVGALISTFSLVPARLLARFHHLGKREIGSYLSCAMFSNVGFTFGGFLCFALLGEKGYTLSLLYSLYMTPFFYTIGFYVARYYGVEGSQSLIKGLKATFAEPVSLCPIMGLIAGLGLNMAEISRPIIITSANRILIPVTTFLVLFGVGLTLKFRKIKEFKKVCFSISLMKFVYSPLIGLILAYAMGYSRILNKLPLKVVFIEASMPVAINVLILTNLFGLDKDLVNSCWISTTLASIVIIPLIMLGIRFI